MSAQLSYMGTKGRAEMFSVREVPWHRDGDVVQIAPKTADEALDLALGKRDENGLIIPNSAWDVITVPDMQYRGINAQGDVVYAPGPDTTGDYFPNPENHRFVRSDGGFVLSVPPKSREPIPNRAVFEFAQAIAGEDDTAQFETGGALDDGRFVWALVRLEDPIEIEGDNGTVTMPYAVVKSGHDGNSSLSAEFTFVRVVCMNTFRASEMVASQYQSRYSVRHTKNWEARLEEATEAMKGLKRDLQAYKAMMETLAKITVTDEQWTEFLETMFYVPSDANHRSVTVQNALRDRQAIERIRQSQTTEQVAHTAYGMLQASGEFFDWERKTRDQKTGYLKRTMLQKNDAKGKATELVCRVAGIKGGARGLRELAGLTSK